MPKGILESQVGMESDVLLPLLATHVSFIMFLLGVCAAYVSILPGMVKSLPILLSLGGRGEAGRSNYKLEEQQESSQG